MCVGKLPYTVYPADYVTSIKMSDMEMTSGPGRSYRYYKGGTLWCGGTEAQRHRGRECV